MAGKKGQKKRFRADEEKRSICEQALAPGVSVGVSVGASVAQVARRYWVNANLIFKWLKDLRFSPAADETQMASKGGSIFRRWRCRGHPLIIIPTTRPWATRLDICPLLAHWVDLTLSDGRRVVVEGPTALPAVIGLVQGLMA